MTSVKNVVLMACVITMFCRGDAFLDEAMARYDFDSWAGTTNALYMALAEPLAILSLDLQTNGICPTTKYVDDADAGERRLMLFSPVDKNFQIRIRAKQVATVLDAQTELVRTLSDFALVWLFTATNGLAGDRCYCKFTTNGYGYVAFTRNNVFADVLTYTTNQISAADIAARLDSAILDASTNTQHGASCGGGH